MHNDDIGREIFMFVCDSVKQGLSALALHFTQKHDSNRYIKTTVKAEKARAKINEPVHGKQSVKTLMQHNQQLNSIDISTDSSLRNFNSIAKKHGMDFAVKKNTENGKFLIFFKARDIDVMASVFQEFSNKELNKNTKKESLLNKLKENENSAKEQQKELHNQAEKEVKIPENDIGKE